ncbi:MAG: alpha/beta hydrolase [Pseudomonadota bacterium]
MILIHLTRLCAALLAALTTASVLHAQNTQFSVPFLTVRDLETPQGPTPNFGDGRSSLRAGRCVVEDVNTGAFSDVLALGPTFLREQLLRVETITVQDPAALLAKAPPAAATPLALYVHGYFIDFDKGCRRAALLQQNAQLAGRMIWFTWPSDGDIANYVQDEADLYWSVPDIADAILAVNARSKAAGGADIIGHSLGGRGVTLALAEVARRAPDTRLGDVVLLAPDMDFDIFARLLSRIRPIAKRITVYVSDKDRPLDLSEELHGYPRLGQAGNDVAGLDGVEFIDVSTLPAENPSGHLYHIHNAAVGRDLARLLNDDLPASDRPHLAPSGANTWVILPD